MDVEISAPQTPVTVVPGTESRAEIGVHNRSSAPISVRLSVAPSRAGAWARIDAPSVALAAGERTTLEIAFRPPADVPPTATLLPFTVRGEDLTYGVPAGRATGLVSVAAPRRLDASLTREPAARGPVEYTLRLANLGDAALTLRLEAELDPPGRIAVEPATVDIPGGQVVNTAVRVRPRVPLVGSPTRYVVVVACRDAVADPDAPPLATVDDDGMVRPRLGRRPAGVLATTLLVLAALGAVLVGTDVRLPGRGPATAATTAPPAEQVRRPYALVDVFPQRDATGRSAAEAALARLTAAGMPVRLVDSTTSDVVADGDGGLWVLLQDGLASVEEARGYCDRYRSVAPKCDVVP